MWLTIFGATGGTGRRLVREALEVGHEVTAVVRDPRRLDAPGNASARAHLRVEVADPLDAGSLVPIVTGRHAVISALGSRGGRAPTTICSAGTHSIIEAMGKAGTRRLLAVSNSGMIIDAGDGPVVRLVGKPILQRVLKAPYADVARMDGEVRDSNLDWTLVRPPRLTDGPPTGRYRTSLDRNIRGGRSITRADLATGILRMAGDPATIHGEIFIAN